MAAARHRDRVAIPCSGDGPPIAVGHRGRPRFPAGRAGRRGKVRQTRPRRRGASGVRGDGIAPWAIELAEDVHAADRPALAALRHGQALDQPAGLEGEHQQP